MRLSEILLCSEIISLIAAGVFTLSAIGTKNETYLAGTVGSLIAGATCAAYAGRKDEESGDDWHPGEYVHYQSISPTKKD